MENNHHNDIGPQNPLAPIVIKLSNIIVVMIVFIIGLLILLVEKLKNFFYTTKFQNLSRIGTIESIHQSLV